MTKKLEKALYFHNPWWLQKRVPEELLRTFQRPVIEKLYSYIESLDRVVIIKGPRRTGKTTLMHQIIDRLISDGVKPMDILFLSFDDLNIRLDMDEIFGVYTTVREKTLKEGTIYCFLDEVHFLENWSFAVKKYFDKRYPIKFIVSSSSAYLFKRSTESLAGRTIEETILPFSFKEFVLYYFKDDANFTDAISRDKLTPYEDRLQILFKEFLTKGGFPHLLDVKDPFLWRKLLKEDVLEKVIYRDLVQLYGIRTPEKLERTFLYLTNITAQMLNISSLAKEVGISRQHLERFVHYLEQAYLIFQLRRFSASASKAIRGLPKVHLVDPGLCSVLSISSQQDFIVESTVARDLMEVEGRVYFYRNNFEVDIVFDSYKEIIPIEVKNKQKPEGADLKGLVQFIRKFGGKRGILLCQSKRGLYEKDEVRIEIMPIWWWLLKKGEIINSS